MSRLAFIGAAADRRHLLYKRCVPSAHEIIAAQTRAASAVAGFSELVRSLRFRCITLQLENPKEIVCAGE
jgi:hypothetical protein